MTRITIIILALALLGGAGYAASLTRISGTANFQVSFNQPDAPSAAEEAYQMVALAMPDALPMPKRKPSL